jgi:hypothetical protein
VLLITPLRQEVHLLLFQEDNNHTKPQLHKEMREEQMEEIMVHHIQVEVAVGLMGQVQMPLAILSQVMEEQP